MRMKKYGVVVGCSNCRYVSAGGPDSFDVLVPISDSETGLAGTARLHCKVSRRSHSVALSDWCDHGQHALQPSEDLRQRLSKALSFVAQHRICGNRAICPAEVVKLVGKVDAD